MLSLTVTSTWQWYIPIRYCSQSWCCIWQWYIPIRYCSQSWCCIWQWYIPIRYCSQSWCCLWQWLQLGSDAFPLDTVRNLGVVFDSDFNFRQHISQVCNSCFYHIRDFRRIRRHISISTAKTISTALISSRLDYCKSLLNNIAKRDLAKLQRAQHCLARVVLRAPRFFTVTTTT